MPPKVDQKGKNVILPITKSTKMVCFSLSRKFLLCDYRTVTTTRRGGREKMTWKQTENRYGELPIALLRD